MCRILVGGAFIVSGVAKSIDLWGFIYKINQYLATWQIPMPTGVVFAVAAALSLAEFLLGFLLITGSYKRTCAWCIGAIMAFMLPLTLYIAIANPVPDCGCFGDMLVISNTATFIKNVVLSLLVAYLIVKNSSVPGLFTAYSQWLVAFIATIYIIFIELFGYNIQPLIDFRPYPVGTPLGKYARATGEDDIPEYTFIYEKDGVKQIFTEDSLPDDSWTFVDRTETKPTEKSSDSLTFDGMITVYDEDESEATSEAITDEGEEILLLIPDMHDLDVSSTYLINEINRYISSRGGTMVAIIATNKEGIDIWRDLSLADYPIYTSEDTSIKEIARGNIAIVYLRDGIIQWKRSLSSIDAEQFEHSNKNTLSSLNYSGQMIMLILTLAFLGLEFILWILDRSGRAVKLHFTRKNQKKSVNLHIGNE
jgi:uncharacterized membrane protein YphA (DoxX/SURF4 family)